MNHIIQETTGELKTIAKKRLKGYWRPMVISMIILSVLVDIVPQILVTLSPDSLILEYEGIKVSYMANMYDFFTTGAFAAGMCSLMLVFFRERDTHPGHLFNGYGYYFKSFSLMIIKGVYIFLWSLLFIVPGIIAAFNYSQAYYILADHPEKSVFQCIRESKAIMAGNKARYFIMLLSFIGYYFLLALVQSALLQMGFSGLVINLVAIIPAAALAAYVGTTETVFFELLIGNLKGRTMEEAQFNGIPEEVRQEERYNSDGEMSFNQNPSTEEHKTEE